MKRKLLADMDPDVHNMRKRNGLFIQKITMKGTYDVCFGLMVRAPACRSRGQWFDSTSAVSKLAHFRSPHFARVFRKRYKKPLVQTPALAQDRAVWSITT